MRSSRHFIVLLCTVLLITALVTIDSNRRARASQSTSVHQSAAIHPQGVLADSQTIPTATVFSNSSANSSAQADIDQPDASDSQIEFANQPQNTINFSYNGPATGAVDSLLPSEVEPSPTPSPSTSPSSSPSSGPSSGPTHTQSLTPAPTQTPNPTATSTPAPRPTLHLLNGIPSHNFVIMDDQTRLHIREIFAKGQALGRNPRSLSRIGASIIETDQFLVRFGSGDYDLGPYSYLQPVVDFFSPSFERYGVGIRRGLSAWMVLDPDWADNRQCSPEETMVTCEIRLNNPSVLIIVLGTNDIGSVERFETSMRQIIEIAIAEGVIPILTTKADRYEGGNNRNNEVIERIAASYQIPLWNFDVVARTLPGRGLARDNVHLTFLYEFEFNQPESLQRGYGLYNLTALMVLEEVWHEMKTAMFGYPQPQR